MFLFNISASTWPNGVTCCWKGDKAEQGRKGVEVRVFGPRSPARVEGDEKNSVATRMEAKHGTQIEAIHDSYKKVLSLRSPDDKSKADAM